MRRVIVRIGATGAGALLALGLLAGPSAAKDSDKQSSADKARESNKVTCFQPDGQTRTQGRSLSDPDGDENGGADKPGCTGGFDADRDGNNGCGNDADREDDNNGNCGRLEVERDNQVRPQRVERDDDDCIRNDADDEGDRDDRNDDDDDARDDDDDGCVEKEPGDAKVGVEQVGAEVNLQAVGSVPAAGVLAADASTSAPTTVLGASLTAPDSADTTTPTTAPGTEVLGETLSAPDTLARTGAGIGGLALLGGLLVGGGRLTVLARKLLRIG